MKHQILIEFEADKLPDDFTDQVAGRIYMMPCVKKNECTASLLTAPAAPVVEPIDHTKQAQIAHAMAANRTAEIVKQTNAARAALYPTQPKGQP